MINYANYKKYDVSNGTGVRHTLFVSGCTHNCKGCFNKEAQDFNYGKPFDNEIQNTIIEDLKEDYIAGLSIIGGEPFENTKGLTPFVKRVKEEVGKNIWVWSGYKIEEILADDKKKELLKYMDVLIDGPFIIEEKDLKLKFRGSRNQRLINLKDYFKTI